MARLDPESRKRGVSLYVSRSRTRVLVRGVRWPDGDRDRAERWERRMDPATARRCARAERGGRRRRPGGCGMSEHRERPPKYDAEHALRKAL
jgi:hypothetical protein